MLFSRAYVVPLLMCVALTGRAEWFNDSQNIMGTDVSVTLWHENAPEAESAIAAVMAEMKRIDTTLSPYKPTSELFQVNAAATSAVITISAELVALIDKSLYYSELSQGAFDISFASVGRYYDYRNGRQPDSERRENLLEAIDYRLIKLDRNQRTLAFAHPQLQIDLGGIAKGYAVDRAIAILRKRGVRHAMASAGGDSRVLGDKRGRPWFIGIKNPRAKKEEVAVYLPLTDAAVSTSGDYERFFIDRESGKRIHHILNPKTGRSASTVTSVTIIGANGFDTDPLSTTVFVLGVKKGIALLNRLKGFDGIIIDRAGKVHYSDGLTPPQ